MQRRRRIARLENRRDCHSPGQPARPRGLVRNWHAHGGRTIRTVKIENGLCEPGQTRASCAPSTKKVPFEARRRANCSLAQCRDRTRRGIHQGRQTGRLQRGDDGGDAGGPAQDFVLRSDDHEKTANRFRTASVAAATLRVDRPKPVQVAASRKMRSPPRLRLRPRHPPRKR